MKKLILTVLVLMASVLVFPLFSQTETEPVALGLPGDNFNLYAVLDVFQKSKTLEEFEREINDRENNINNLDLNNDNYIDYIGVVSHKEGNTNLIVLRDIINDRGFQDVAVIEVTKTNGGAVFIQIIGDEDLYGEDYIIEPSGAIYTTRTPNPGYVYPDGYSISGLRGDFDFYINDWPIVINLFTPSFRVYISPWYWGYYPSYWRPWSPIFYYNYWSFNHHYYQNNLYRRNVSVRYPSYYSNYVKRRNVSPIVNDYRRSGTYDRTYEGRTFKRPTTPTRPQGESSRRPGNQQTTRPQGESSRRPGNQQTTRPQGEASRKPGNQQTTRPQGESSRRPGNQQTTRPQGEASRKLGNQQTTRTQGESSRRPGNQQTTRPQGEPSRRSENQQTTRPQGESSRKPGNQQTTRPQVQPQVRQENRQPARPQVQPPVRQENRQPARPQVQPPARQENRQSARPQGPPSARQENRQSARPQGQPAREAKKSNPPERQN
ncbi:hypothetical protein ACMDB5_00610 [Flavobacterium sp. W1B]|uniref:hypothetical protein n=1 Tax=Flavobacterium sp. W1B TaxID=3394146 RepID=UPI0039BCC0E7